MVIQEFLSVTLAFPTLLFTGLVLLAMLYWILVILGALGLDALDLDAEGSADAGFLSAARGWLGLRHVPLTVVLSLVFLFGWLFTHLGTLLLLERWDASVSRAVGGTVLLFASLALALPLTSLLLRPLGSALQPERPIRREDQVGRIVRIDSSRVDEKVGTARDDEGSVLHVRCEAPNGFERGSKALVVSFDEAREVYVVAPLHDIVPSEVTSTKT